MSRYQSTPSKSSIRGSILQTTRYLEIPLSTEDIYTTTTIGDRYDTLASHYYGKSSLWWVIVIANPQFPKDSLIPPIGVQIRIPEIANAFSIANQYGTY